MKKLILLLCVALVACDEHTEEVSGKYKLPKELSDCKVFYLYGEGQAITAMRCPNSSTSVVTGSKTKRKTIVVDGVSYEEQVK